MEEVKLSECSTEEVEKFSNKILIVDTGFSRHNSELIFDNCVFKFSNQGTLRLTSCIIQNCIFQGLDDCNSFDTQQGAVVINGCKFFKNNKFEKQFKILDISDSLIFDLIDNSIITDYHCKNSDVTDSIIKGECRRLSFENVIFQSTKNKTSLFDKIIVIRADCVNVVLDNVDVNPFYFATKCPDKTTIDLTKATLIDNWSRLRKNYAGLSLFIVFFLIFLFLLPLLTHSFFLLIFSKIDIEYIKVERLPLWEALLFGSTLR